MRWLVLCFVIWDTISSQPITDEKTTDNARPPRQIDFVECCPCPPRTGLRDMDFVGSGPSSGISSVPRADVDDCPCRARGADSDTAPSMLFPDVMRPFPLKPVEEKAEPKPLLHPEVDLASSVLETLKEATDEEYRDALARDAARNSAKSASAADTAPEEAKNIVTIILSPNETSNEDAMSEASDVQESRWIHPIGKSSIPQMRVPEYQPVNDIFKLPIGLKESPHRSDMVVEASNAREQVLEESQEKEDIGQSSSNSLIDRLKSTPSNNVKNMLQLRNNKDKNTNMKALNLPEIKRTSLLDALNEHRRRLDNLRANRFKSVAVPKLGDGLDSTFSPSNAKEHFADIAKAKSGSNFGINQRKHLHLKDLLKLRDVELIPPKTKKPILNLPDLKWKPAGTSRTSITLPSLKPTPNMNIREQELNIDGGEDKDDKGTNIQVIPKEKVVHTEVIDTVPSPSNIKRTGYFDSPIIKHSETRNNFENADIEQVDQVSDLLNPEDKIGSTEILDVLPSPSEHQHTVLSAEKSIEFGSSSSEEDPNDTEQFGAETGNDTPNKGMNEQEVIEQDISDDNDKTDFQDGNTEAEGFTDALEVVDQLGLVGEANNQAFIQEEQFQSSEEKDKNDDTINYYKNENTEFITNDNTMNIDNDEPYHESYGKNEPEFDISNEEEIRTMEDIKLSDLELLDAISAEKLSLEAPLLIQAKPEDDEPEQQLNIADLQRRSDSVLQEEVHDFSKAVKDPEVTSGDLISKEVYKSNPKIASTVNSGENSSDMKLSASSPHLTVTNPNTNPKLTEAITDTDSQENFNGEEASKESFNVDDKIEENTCLTKLATPIKMTKTVEKYTSQPKTDDTFIDNTRSKEMTAEASEPVFKLVPETSPKSVESNDFESPLSSLSLNRDPIRLPSLSELLNINRQLPTLEDIQTGISNLLAGSNRHAENEDMIFNEPQSECSEMKPEMRSDASTASFRSAKPASKHSENINLNIFELNPFKAGPLSPKIPALNLNSFKTRLALPRSMGLKPVKLQSAFERNGRLFGTTMTFGPEKFGARKSMSKVSGPRSNILGSHINVPSLEKIKTTMRGNAESLLKPPLSSVKVPSHSMRTAQGLGDNIRAHTENTAKKIHHTLASSINHARNGEGGKYARPENLLEMVSSAHEDMNDKLQAIHSDLKDRLSSIHERIIDQARIASIGTPTTKSTGVLNKAQSRGSLLRKPEHKTSGSRVPKPSFYSNAKSPLRSTSSQTPSKQTNSGLVPQVKSRRTEQKLKPFKISKAASSLMPKTVEVPKLVTTSTKPPFLMPLERDFSVKLKDVKPFNSNLPKSATSAQDDKQSDGKNAIVPVRKNKLQTSFNSDTKPVSNFRSRPETTRKSPTLMKASILRDQKSTLTPTRPSQRSKSVSDSKTFASEPKPTKLAPPKSMKVKYAADDEMSTKKETLPRTPTTLTKPKYSVPKNTKSRLASSPFSHLKKANGLPKLDLPSRKALQPLIWPKHNESLFLSKVREAMKARLAGANQKAKKIAAVEDMTKSASENREVVKYNGEPMKENVSYKCTMVCVREH